MPRSTRSRQPSTIISSGNYVVELPKLTTKFARLKNATAKSSQGKGSSNKFTNVDVLSSIKSPVLRDRTNLTEETTTKLDVLKKGPDAKEAVDVMIPRVRTRKSKTSKPSIDEFTENIQITETKMKKNIPLTKKEGKISKSKDFSVPTTSRIKSIVPTSRNERKMTDGKNVSRQVSKNTEDKKKLSTFATRRTKKTVIEQSSESDRKTRAHSKNVNDSKLESPRKSPRSKLKVSPTSSSTQKANVKPSVKRTPRLSANKVTNDSPKLNNAKKFFRSKLRTPATLPAHSKITPMKKRTVRKKARAAATRKNTNEIAGVKLSPSFRLREKTIPAENKVDSENIKKRRGPIYRWVHECDVYDADKDKVYEFVFDLDDSEERVRKKRKKRVVRKAPAKKAKIAPKELQSKSKSSSKLPVKKNEKPPATIDNNLPTVEIVEINDMGCDNKITTVTAEIHLPPTESSHINTTPHSTSVNESHSEQHFNLTVTPLQPRPVTNESTSSNNHHKFNLRPSAQFKTMMDASLLRRSLSPIPNEVPKENIGIDNPWRAPPLSTFSRVKNVFQSTPQGKKFGTLLGKAALTNAMTPKPQRLKMRKILEQNDENANISLTKISPRKFGTVISNINNNFPIKRQSEHINTSKSPRKFGTVISNIHEFSSSPNSISNERTRLPTNNERSMKQPTLHTSFPDYDEIVSITDETFHDKENSVPKSGSSKETPMERIDSPCTNPLRSDAERGSVETESLPVVEPLPLPGPSGAQVSNKSPDSWKLKQSNLDKFLNLPDMPSSTRITTAHGLFDDAHSTTVVGKPVKKMTIESLDVNNAFGFDDEDTIDIDQTSSNVCPSIEQPLIQDKLRAENVLTSKKSNNAANVQQPMRFSISEMRKKLLVSRAIDNKKKKKENVPAINDNYASVKKKEVIKAIDFSDTFDEIIDEVDEENVKEIPLFVDVEPVHFTQPPRFSYSHKRKRNLSWNTSEETEEDEGHEEHHKRTKKRRIGKAEREQKKVLDDWAKSMNNTFNEIDHFDLVVE